MEETKNPKFKGSRSLTHKWEGMEFSQWGKEPMTTGYNLDDLVKIAESSVEIPEGMLIHDKLKRFHIASRLK